MQTKHTIFVAVIFKRQFMNKQTWGVAALFALACLTCHETATAQTINGTLRAKYEYQTEEGESRFSVRTARVSVSGNIKEIVDYKAEIDLCDEGTMKMLDAYARFKPFKDTRFTIGQFRVPFTIDAHRAPHNQYFANRSFIAKQVGNVRDVGAALSYTANSESAQLIAEAGIFNGSGLTEQKDFWTKSVNFSAKAQLFLPIASLKGGAGNDFRGFNITLSTQKIRPNGLTIMMYDAGAYFQSARWHIEAEYLYKTYAHDAFQGVHAINSFVCYDFPIRHKTFTKISPLIRFDRMTDHSNGPDEDGVIAIDDYERSRVTAGATLSLSKPFNIDIRLNFEKYFYPDESIPAVSERDKVVCEFMVRF